jgi:anaerobic C4-dicarboxylate transporter
MIMATDAEVATILDLDITTVENAKKDPEYQRAMKAGRAKGRMSVRRAQFNSLKKHVAMQIFLGKALLGQSEFEGVGDPNDPISEIKIAVSRPTRIEE